MNSVDSFASQERASLNPPEPTAYQEYVTSLYQQIQEAEDEIERQMDKRANAWDLLRDIGAVG